MLFFETDNLWFIDHKDKEKIVTMVKFLKQFFLKDAKVKMVHYYYNFTMSCLQINLITISKVLKQGSSTI